LYLVSCILYCISHILPTPWLNHHLSHLHQFQNKTNHPIFVTNVKTFLPS
jgi:hypothetical protein